MKDVQVSDMRTFVLLGHTGSGKTTLTDALLFKMGANDRMGLVSNESSMADYTDEEKAHKITIHAKPFSGSTMIQGKKSGFVFCDTPGFPDFCGQVILAMRAAESALVVVDAHAGLQVGSLRGMKQAESMGMPTGIVVTGIDRENTEFSKVLQEIQNTWGAACVPVLLPDGKGGVIDILSGGDAPEALADSLREYRARLSELAAETDDVLIEKYLGGEALAPAEIAAGLRKAVMSRTLIPIFAVYPLKGVGMGELLAGASRLFPSPLELPKKNAAGDQIDPRPEAPFVGFVWRTVNDPFVGQLAFVRVCGGALKADLDIQNVNKEQKERIATLMEVNGRKQANMDVAMAGDIVALAKLKHTGLGDSLCAAGTKITFAPFVFPHPVIWNSVVGKTQGDEDKIGIALARIAEEDPTIRVERSHDTHETIVSGMGDTQLAVAVERMKKRSNVDVLLHTPKIPYKETVTGRGEGHYKHKKQSGGRGQYGEVYLKVEPRPANDEEWFVDDIVGGVIPGNYIPAVQKGLAEGMVKGALAGYPVINVKVRVYDGSYHDVDSSEIAFKIAASRAFRDGMSKAKPVLLEPIMNLRITVPEHYMGDVSGDLSHRRGRIQGMESNDGMQVIVAEAPQSELFHYCAELRSMTGGRGTFEVSFNRYDVVPSNVAQKVIAEAAKHKQEEEE